MQSVWLKIKNTNDSYELTLFIESETHSETNVVSLIKTKMTLMNWLCLVNQKHTVQQM